MTNVFETSENRLVELFLNGQLKSFTCVNDKYISWSGNSVSDAKYTNFMLASYITSRARMQLIEGVEACLKAGMIPIYSDTDSIYASLDSPSFTQDKFDLYIKPLLHDSKLGAFKLEMHDNVG